MNTKPEVDSEGEPSKPLTETERQRFLSILEKGYRFRSQPTDEFWLEYYQALQEISGPIRQFEPHHHSPDDLVPEIKLPPNSNLHSGVPSSSRVPDDDSGSNGMDSSEGMDYDASYETLDVSGVHSPRDADTDVMMKRVIVSVNQFTSYRGFTWIPLGSLRRRLRPYDSGVIFQRSVEWMVELGAAVVEVYDNPQSDYQTKGISLILSSAIVRKTLKERDDFIHALLNLYEQRLPINFMTLSQETNLDETALKMWISMMQTENVLNPMPGKPGLYSLFRTNPTVNLVAEARHSQQ